MKRLILLAVVAAALGAGATALAQGGGDPYLQAEPDVSDAKLLRLPSSARGCDDTRSVTVRVTPPTGAVLGSVRVVVDGRQLARLTGVPRAASATVRVPRSGARVTASTETLGGQKQRVSRVYSDCSQAAPSPQDTVGVGEG